MKKTGYTDYADLPARDIWATKRFFTDAFGWAFVDHDPDYVSMQDAGLNGRFYRSDRVATMVRGSAGCLEQ